MLKVGDITTKDKSSNANFLKCEGQVIGIDEAPKLKGVLDYHFPYAKRQVVTSGVKKILYEKNIYVSFSDSSIMSSFDGKTWTTRIGQTYGRPLLSLTFGNGFFVVTLSGNSTSRGVYISTDGMAWIYQNANFGYSNPNVAYGDGRFLVEESTISLMDHSFAFTTDFLTFERTLVPAGTKAFSILYGDGMWNIFSSDGKLLYSADGKTWSQKVLLGGSGAGTSYFANGKYFFLSGNSSQAIIYYISEDGINYRPVYRDEERVPGRITSLVFSEELGVYVCISDMYSAEQGGALIFLLFSVDGENWIKGERQEAGCAASVTNNYDFLFARESGSYFYLVNTSFLLPSYSNPAYLKIS